MKYKNIFVMSFVWIVSGMLYGDDQDTFEVVDMSQEILEKQRLDEIILTIDKSLTAQNSQQHHAPKGLLTNVKNYFYGSSIENAFKRLAHYTYEQLDLYEKTVMQIKVLVDENRRVQRIITKDSLITCNEITEYCLFIARQQNIADDLRKKIDDYKKIISRLVQLYQDYIAQLGDKCMYDEITFQLTEHKNIVKQKSNILENFDTNLTVEQTLRSEQQLLRILHKQCSLIRDRLFFS